MTAALGHVGPGLSNDEVRARANEHGPNVLPAAERPTLGSRLVRELREPMAVLLIAAAALSGLLLGEIVDAVAIIVIVVVNAVIALVQEGRAEHALEALQRLEAPVATVLRDGGRQVVDADGLVPGDVVLLQAGDRVPADLEVLEASVLQADESILTGESLAAHKRAGGTTSADAAIGDRDGLLHSGTLVTRGSAVGHVVAIGAHTELGAIAQRLHDVRQEPTPLQRQLSGLTRRLGLAAVVIAAGTFGLALLVDEAIGTEEAFLTAVALAVAAVPEGLAAVTTVALALGVGRMAKRGAIVRRLPAVETLGATDVLVIDKTGTVTVNRMRMTAVIDTDGKAWDTPDIPSELLAAVGPVLVLCNDATTEPPTGDPTERGLLDVFSPEDVEAMRRAHPRRGVAPFESDRKRMSTVHELDGRLVVLTKGAPEVVLPRCARAHSVGAGPRDLDEAAREDLLAVAEHRASRGERLLALATRQVEGVPADVETVEEELVLVGIAALRDPPRASAASSVAAVADAGVTLLMATGDHPGTAAAVAEEIGLGRAAPLTGPGLRISGLPEDPTTAPVYARVDPDQKLDLVTRLQQQDHTVAMTGDGVNDAPALRRADIGVALGATGSDVAREAADLVITDDDLATIVEAVREGRGIYDNLRKVIDYLVISNLAEIGVVVGALLLIPALGVPLFPLQLLWINLLTDGLPALALGVDPVDPTLMRRRPRPAGSRLLGIAHLRRLASRAVVVSAGALAVLWVAVHVSGLAEAEARTVLFTTLVVAQVLLAFVVRRSAAGRVPPVNRWLWWSAVGSVAAQALIIFAPAAQGIFDTAVPPVEGWWLILAGGLVPPVVVGVLEAVRAARRGEGAGSA